MSGYLTEYAVTEIMFATSFLNDMIKSDDVLSEGKKRGSKKMPGRKILRKYDTCLW